MNIEKAIENLTQLSNPPEIIFAPDDIEAVKLGIEALKREQYYRRLNSPLSSTRLPGETKE